MGRWFNKRESNAERRHREVLAAQREQIDQTARLGTSGRRIQLVALAVTALGVVVSLAIWHPWSQTPAAGAVPRAVLHLLPGSHDAFVPAAAANLPRPPAVPAVGDRCERWWAGWFQQQRAAEDSPPTIAVSAPATADVAIVRASVKVFHAYRPRSLSYVACATGAGPGFGTLLQIDLAHPDATPTIVADDGSNVPLAMPNAVINVAPGHTEYVALTVSGARLMYEWEATLTVVVDQHTTTVSFGTPAAPLRSWLGPRTWLLRHAAYDYDFVAGKWRKA